MKQWVFYAPAKPDLKLEHDLQISQIIGMQEDLGPNREEHLCINRGLVIAMIANFNKGRPRANSKSRWLTGDAGGMAGSV